jgi:hypothetical protein
MTSARPFPPLLVAGLIAPLFFFAAAFIVTSLGVVLWGAAIVLEAIAVPIALLLMARGGYRSRANIIILCLAASPIVLVVFGVLTFFLGGVHL